MKLRIARVSVNRSAITIAVVYFLASFIYIPLVYVAEASAPPNERLGALWLLLPVAMLVIGYLGTALMLFLYNVVSYVTGGVEITPMTEVVSGDAGARGRIGELP